MVEPIAKKIVDREELDKDIDSLFNDSEIKRMFEGMSDYEDESLDYDIQKYDSTEKMKMREKKVYLTKERKGVVSEKLVFTVTDERKSLVRVVHKALGSSSKLPKPSETLAYTGKELVPHRSLVLPLERRKVCLGRK